MDFILEVPRCRYRQSDITPKIRISQEAYAVLTEMCAKTAIPMSRIASQAILYAAQNLQIKQIGNDEEEEN